MKEFGGAAYTDVMEMEQVGRFATLGDPQGAPIAILQPDSGG